MERHGRAAAPAQVSQDLPGDQARALVLIRSRDNARVKRWAKLSQDGRFRRQERRALVEGPHLVSAAIEAGVRLVCLLVSESRRPDIEPLLGRAGVETVELQENIFRTIVDADTPQGIAAEIELPAERPSVGETCVFLEGIQDAGNVGAIIRSAAAFGIGVVVLDNQCADPWSPKTLRAGMGGHFALSIRSVAGLQKELETFPGRLLCTVARGGEDLSEADLSGQVGWVFGREGSGLSEAARANADLLVTIPLAAGVESLNVAATAAICFYQGRPRT